MDIHEAAKIGNIDQLRACLKCGTPVDFVSEDGQTALMEAAAEGRTEAVRFLLSVGADPRRFNSRALDFAVRFGNAESVSLLLQAGADPNRSNPELDDEDEEDDEDDDPNYVRCADPTPLFEAVLRGNREIIQQLRSAGARMDSVFNRQGLLAAAVFSKDESIFADLFDQGVDFTGVLLAAIDHQKPHLVEQLLSVPQKVNLEDEDANGMTAICLAAYKGDLGLLEKLLFAGANMEHKDQIGRTALAHAVSERRNDAVEFLLRSGASIENAQTDDPLLVSASLMSSSAVVGVLLSAGADVEKKDEDGQTALLAAISGKRLKNVSLLLKAGADPNAAAPVEKKKARQMGVPPGATPLIAAVRKNSVALVEVLLAAGTQVDQTDAGGKNATDHAAKFGLAEILNILRNAGGATSLSTKEIASAQLLRSLEQNKGTAAIESLSQGADPDAVDKTGKSALNIAVDKGMVDVVDLLLRSGADPNRRSKYGESPMRAACVRSHATIVRRLIESGGDVNAKFDAGSIPADQENTVFSSLETPLHDAAMWSSVEILQMLIDAGADLNAVGKTGWSPLVAAVNSRRMDSVQVLLEAGAVERSEDAVWLSSYRFAEMAKRPAYVRLVERMAAELGECESNPNLPGVAFFRVRTEIADAPPAPLDSVEAGRAWGERFAARYSDLDAKIETARLLFKDEATAAGALVLDAGKPIGCGPMVQYLAALPSSDPYEAMAAFGLRGNDQEIRTEEMIKRFRELQQLQPFELVGVRFDTASIVFREPPKDALALANFLANFCHDLVGVSETSIAKLAQYLASNRRVNLWWD